MLYPHSKATFMLNNKRDSTDDRAVALYLAYPGLNTDDSSFMLQRALANNEKGPRRTLIAALLQWLDYKTLRFIIITMAE